MNKTAIARTHALESVESALRDLAPEEALFVALVTLAKVSQNAGKKFEWSYKLR